MTLTFLVIVIITALVFEYINGFHDSANAIATVVSTQVLTPRHAILFAAVLNFVGALAGTHVAKTIGAGMVDTAAVTQVVIPAALIGAIVWNLITWYFGIPSSSSHALIGGLVGATVAHRGWSMVKADGVFYKVILPMFGSPLLGFIAGLLFMLALLWLASRSRPTRVNKLFRRLQLVSSAFMAFSHGSNDAQKTMGIITLALVAFGTLSAVEVPTWVIVMCAATMCLGTAAGGWRIVHTMGNRVIKLKPIHGFAAETSAASVIVAASLGGIPVSTTHVISTSIMGVGSTVNPSAVKWGLVGTIVKAWLLTIPICFALSWGTFLLLRLAGL